MGDYDSILNGVNEANVGGSYTDRLPLGTHDLVLKEFRVKTSKKDGAKIVEADFLVLGSDSKEAPAGSVFGWAWFIDSKGWGGTYAKSFLKDFFVQAGDCIGDTRDPQTIGGDLLCPAQKGRGLNLKAVVKNGKKTNDKGEPFVEVAWKAIPQTLEQVAETRAGLDDMDGQAPAAAAAPVRHLPTPVAPMPPPAAAPRTGGILAGLRK